MKWLFGVAVLVVISIHSSSRRPVGAAFSSISTPSRRAFSKYALRFSKQRQPSFRFMMSGRVIRPIGIRAVRKLVPGINTIVPNVALAKCYNSTIEGRSAKVEHTVSTILCCCVRPVILRRTAVRS